MSPNTGPLGPQSPEHHGTSARPQRCHRREEVVVQARGLLRIRSRWPMAEVLRSPCQGSSAPAYRSASPRRRCSRDKVPTLRDPPSRPSQMHSRTGTHPFDCHREPQSRRQHRQLAHVPELTSARRHEVFTRWPPAAGAAPLDTSLCKGAASEKLKKRSRRLSYSMTIVPPDCLMEVRRTCRSAPKM